MSSPPKTASRPSARPSYVPQPVGKQEERVLWALIAVNVLVFVAWQSVDDLGLPTMAAHFLVSGDAVAAGRVWTLLTSAFSHVDATHLLFNMLSLYVFGRPVARALGAWQLLHLYVAGALVASLGHVGFGLASGDPSPALGASGAVMAIAVVFAAMFPRVTLLISFLVPVPAGIAVLLYVLIDLAGVLGGLGGLNQMLYPGSGGSSIAHAAHLGGALYGALFYWFRVRGR